MIRHQFRAPGQRGFYLIGLLIVLAIIAILYGKQLLPDKQGPGITSNIDRAKGAACSLDRSTLATTLTAWAGGHPGEKATIESMRASGASVPTCPEGGVYEIGSDGTIYCSKHFPRPAQAPPAASGAETQSIPAGPAPGAGGIVTPPPTPDIPAE